MFKNKVKNYKILSVLTLLVGECMSNSKFMTLSSSIPIYNSFLKHLEKLVDVNDKNYCNSSEVCIAILKGYENLKHTIRKQMIRIPMQLQLVIIFFQFFFCLIYTFYIIVFFNLLCIYSYRSTVQIRLLSETGVGTILYWCSKKNIYRYIQKFLSR